MISKLRRQFILINMSFVTVILLIVFASVFTMSYHKARADTEASLHRMLGNGFRTSPPPPAERMPEQPRSKPSVKKKPDGMNTGSPEQRIPMFVITIDNAGSVQLEKSENITVDEELMNSAAEYVRLEYTDEGVIRELNLRYLRRFTQRGEEIAFADRTNETSTVQNIIITSALAGAGGLLAFFAASLFLSGIAVKPVKIAWENQRRFVADASHELKTPITVILANMNILSADKDVNVGSQLKWIENTCDEAQRMKTLVDDMLFLAKSDAQKLNAQPAVLQLGELVTRCALQFEAVAFEKGVTIEVQAEDGVTVSGDERQLCQLFGILLDNACKYSASGTKITATLCRNGSWAEVRVTNYGAVIPKEDASHIFERFYRAEKSRVRKTGGYGLGLAIAESIASAHDGKISVKSSEESGTVFTVRLPVKK